VSVNHLNDAAVSALIELGQPVMIDSGAFSEVLFTEDRPRTIAPIDETEWSRRLGVSIRLASALGNLAVVVAPDRRDGTKDTSRHSRLPNIPCF